MAHLPIVLLHFFGSSQREWDLVVGRFVDREVLTIDLPGFGDAAGESGRGVAGMADRVDERIVAAGFADCVLVGHSMTGKVATLLASRAPDYLRGLVLVTPSPPSPEPFEDDVRKRLLAYDGSRGAAEAYIDGITATRLPDDLREIVVGEAMRASLTAWKRWIAIGSQEDLSAVVGTLTLPTLVVAGEGDPSLGAPIQEELVMPHFTHAQLHVIAGGHVLPLENPETLHREIEGFASQLPSRATTSAGSDGA